MKTDNELKPAEDIIKKIKDGIDSFSFKSETKKVGFVTKVSDGIVEIKGLQDARAGEMLLLGKDSLGLVLNLEEDRVGAVVLGDYEHLHENTPVSATGKVLETPVGNEFIGRVVNPLGRIIDGGDEIRTGKTLPVERVAPGVIERAPVDQPVQTGIKAIDAMIPIGRGQRELIIGDRQTGKTALAVDTIINQKGGDMICIYVAVGQKESKIAKMVAKLEEEGAMEHTIVVVAGASDAASLSYIAPYVGCSMGEHFIDQGKDVLIVFDDLSKHAAAYREVSLLLRRPPGREAYPGDVFYLHSRLLERSAKLSDEKGGGSMTAFPIIETQAGDISAYIPTNVISITDGQIFLESDLFFAGTRPALNVGLSVSRVGSKAQTKIMKDIAGKLKLEAAQYRELAAFAQFGSDLDDKTRQSIERGRRIMEILKQPQYQPLSLFKQIVVLFAVMNGLLDKIKVEKLGEVEEELYDYAESSMTDLDEKVTSKPEMTDEIKAGLKQKIEVFISGLDKDCFVAREKDKKAE